MAHSVTPNWDDLEAAFERNAPGVESYLDLGSGNVVTIIDGQADAQERRLRVARSPESFVKIEPASSREQYRWMEQFVATVPDQALRERLLVAIDGKGAFRRFKDALLDCPGERERWFSYRAALLHRRITAWFEQMGIEPATPPPWGAPPHVEETSPPLRRPGATGGESPGEALRNRARDLVARLPAVELPAAIAFLEYLRERGVGSLFPDRRDDEDGGARARQGGQAQPGGGDSVPDPPASTLSGEGNAG